MDMIRCNVFASPVRKLPSDTAEMVTQVLFGEQVELIENGDKDWIGIKCTWDDYVGWVDQKQYGSIVKPMDELAPEFYCSNKIKDIKLSEEVSLLVGVGSIVDQSVLDNNPSLRSHSTLDIYEGREQKIMFLRQMIEVYLQAPYLWGGRSITGIDCSGFTQVVFGMLHVVLQRDAAQQCNQGRLVGFVTEAEMGDLAFFENDKGNIVHVGIVMDNSEIVHAAGNIRIDKLTNEGILNMTTGKITHKLRLLKRLF